MGRKLEASNNHSRDGRPRNSTYAFYNVNSEAREELINAINDPDVTITSGDDSVKQNNRINLMYPVETSKKIHIDNLFPAPDEWNFFPLPDIETLKLITKSIYAQGQLSPLLVWKREDDKYMILGGHTRYNVMKFLMANFVNEADRFKYLDCHVYGENQITEDDAKYIIISNNMTQRAKESLSLRVKSVVAAMDLQKKITPHKWGQTVEPSSAVVAKSLNISSRTVDRLYRLRTLIEPLLDELTCQHISKQLSMVLACLPPEVQNEFYNSGYHTRMYSSYQLSLMKDAETIDDIKKIASTTSYSTAGAKIITDRAIPRSFEKFSIAASQEDMAKIKELLLNSLNNIQFSNKDSREILLDILTR